MLTKATSGVALPENDARMAAPDAGAACEADAERSPSKPADSPGISINTDAKSPSIMVHNIGKITTVLVVAGIALAIGVISSLSIGTGWRVYTVHGGSMEPRYQQGDLIFTSSAKASHIDPGEIIVFTADWASEKYEQRVVHRVAATGSIDGVPVAYTRGDANSVADPQPVDLTADDVSLVRFSIPNGAFWLQVMTAPYMLAFVLSLLGIAVAVLAIMRGVPTFVPRGIYWPKTEVPLGHSSNPAQREQA